MQPSCAVSHKADTRHRALGGAMVPILSERSSLIPGNWLHHQRSSSSHDASPHPQGERPAKDPLNSAFLDAGACCSAPAPSAVLRITHHANRLLSWKGPSAGAGSGGEHEADGEQKAVGVAGHVAAASRGRAGARVLLRGAAMQVTRVASALCVSSLCTPIAPRCALAICAG